MNTFVVHVARGKESGKHNVSLLEVRPGAEGFTRLSKKTEGILVLKQWRNVYIGKTSKCKGNIAKAEAVAIKQGLENAGFETAKSLYVTGLFNRSHPDLMNFFTTAKGVTDETRS
jgi:hypothetical protein